MHEQGRLHREPPFAENALRCHGCFGVKCNVRGGPRPRLRNGGKSGGAWRPLVRLAAGMPSQTADPGLAKHGNPPQHSVSAPTWWFRPLIGESPRQPQTLHRARYKAWVPRRIGRQRTSGAVVAGSQCSCCVRRALDLECPHHRTGDHGDHGKQLSAPVATRPSIAAGQHCAVNSCSLCSLGLSLSAAENRKFDSCSAHD